MSKLTYPQRLGVLLTAILMLLVVIVIALLPPPKASTPVYQEASDAVLSDTTQTVKPKSAKKAPVKKTTPAPKPAPTPRNPLDEVF